MEESLHMALDQWFVTRDVPPALLVPGYYDAWTVALSLLVAVAASCAALHLAGQARESTHRTNRLVALTSGAAALGAGVWAMHFIGMLAFQLCTQVSYSPGITMASMLPSLAASWVALKLLARPTISPPTLIVGGVLVGAGIGAMHYGGMVAMQMTPNLMFDPWWFAASIVVAVVLAMLALWVRFGLRHGNLGKGASLLLAGLVMGFAITGMHYTGMAAARFVGEFDPAFRPSIADHAVLAMGIALVALAIGVVAIGGTALRRYYQLTQQKTESETRLRAVVDTAVDGIISIDQHGRILSFNPSAERIFGWKAEDVLGRNVSLLMTGQNSAYHDSYLENYLRTGIAKIIGVGREVVGLRSDGGTVPLRLAISRTEVQGEPLFIGMVTDISERKTIERELRERETQYRTLIANIPGVAFRSEAGTDTHMIFVSDAVEALTGWPAQAFVKREVAFDALIHPDDRQRTSEAVCDALGRDSSYAIQYRIRRRDGSERWVSETAGGVRDANGMLQWIDGVMLDVTEARLRNAEFETVATALDRAAATLEVSAGDQTILRVNDNFLRISGYTREELVGQPNTLLFTADYAQGKDYARDLAALRHGEIVSGEYLCLGKKGREGGREFWFDATCNPLTDDAGRVRGFMIFGDDVSARKRMERELREAKARAEQAAAARSAFLANMSHEIRTPMNAIIGFTDVLLATQLSSVQRRHMDTVRSAAQSLLGLLNDILDTAKLEKGAVELEIADFSLRALCEQVSASMRLGAEKKGLALDLDYPATLPDYYRGDALRIQQVLVNLVGNAIKFTAQGKVAIEVRQIGSSTVVAIEDTGIGIPADRIERIFDAFAQADATITRQFGGTGLGTTIARQLVELMGGRIVVRSEPGVGSRFEVHVPLAYGAPPLANVVPNGPRLPVLDILVADDVPQNLELIELVLQADGHRVRSARNGREALDRLREQRYDVVLMDMHMPEMDGLAATRALRELERKQHRTLTPVIALTASVQTVDRHAAFESGMDGFATKPLVKAQLQAEIARVLGLKGADDDTVAVQHPPQRAFEGLIDWVQGIALWQSAERLQEAIAGLLQSLETLPGELEDALGRADLATVAALAHRVSGASGNLALIAVRAAAQALEKTARAGDAAGAAAGAKLLVAQLDNVAEQLPRLSGPAPLETPPAPAMDHAVLFGSLARLRQALEGSAFDEASLHALAQALPAARLRDLLDAMDDFDFARAVICVDALRESLRNDTVTQP